MSHMQLSVYSCLCAGKFSFEQTTVYHFVKTSAYKSLILCNCVSFSLTLVVICKYVEWRVVIIWDVLIIINQNQCKEISYRPRLFLFQACYARVLDFRRKFIEAAVRYNELSYKTMVAEEERITALRNALICTVLASAGT